MILYFLKQKVSLHILCLCLLGFAFSFVLNSGEIEKSENVSKVLPALLSQNALPDNVTLIYHLEEFYKGNWETREKVKLLWDFKGKRANIFSLITNAMLPDDAITLIRQSVSTKVDILVVGGVVRNERNFDVSIPAPTFERLKHASSPYGVINHPGLQASESFNTYMNIFYSTRGSVPFTELLGNVTNAIDISRKSGNGPDNSGIEVAFRNGEKETVKYTFDAIGILCKKEYFFRDEKEDGTLSEQKKISFWDIKKTQKFGGFQIPLILEGNIHMGTGTLAERDIKRRITVDEKSILINQTLTDADFIIQIPVGTNVVDHRSGISYQSDGISNEMEEPLADALAALAKKAKDGNEHGVK
jgi:hypothetical protein